MLWKIVLIICNCNDLLLKLLYAKSNGPCSDTMVFFRQLPTELEAKLLWIIIDIREGNQAIFLTLVRINLIFPDLSKVFSQGDCKGSFLSAILMSLWQYQIVMHYKNSNGLSENDPKRHIVELIANGQWFNRSWLHNEVSIRIQKDWVWGASGWLNTWKVTCPRRAWKFHGPSPYLALSSIWLFLSYSLLR